MLGGGFAMLQVPFVKCLSFYPFSFHQDGLVSSEVDIGGREVAKALVIALVIVVRDEGSICVSRWPVKSMINNRFYDLTPPKVAMRQ